MKEVAAASVRRLFDYFGGELDVRGERRGLSAAAAAARGVSSSLR